MKKFAKTFVVLFATAIIMSCYNPAQGDSGEQTPAKKTAQEIINSADTIADLTGIEIDQKSKLEISKAITVTGGTDQCDMKSSSITVKVSGAVIKNLKNVAELVIDEAVGNGDVTVSGCEIAKLTVKGGGANSIHIENVKVAAVSVAKEGVRLVLEGKSSVAAVEVKAPCVLDSTSKESTIKNLKVESKVKNIEIKGQTQVAKIVATSEDFKIRISSNDVKVTAAAVKTEDGKTSAVKVEAAEGVTVEEIQEIPADELDKLLEEIMSDIENADSDDDSDEDADDDTDKDEDSDEDADKDDESKDTEEDDPSEDDNDTTKDEESKDPEEDDSEDGKDVTDDTTKDEDTKNPEEEQKNPVEDDSDKNTKDPVEEERPKQYVAINVEVTDELSIDSAVGIVTYEILTTTNPRRLRLTAPEGFQEYTWTMKSAYYDVDNIKETTRENFYEFWIPNYHGRYTLNVLTMKDGKYYTGNYIIVIPEE